MHWWYFGHLACGPTLCLRIKRRRFTASRTRGPREARGWWHRPAGIVTPATIPEQSATGTARKWYTVQCPYRERTIRRPAMGTPDHMHRFVSPRSEVLVQFFIPSWSFSHAITHDSQLRKSESCSHCYISLFSVYISTNGTSNKCLQQLLKIESLQLRACLDSP